VGGAQSSGRGPLRSIVTTIDIRSEIGAVPTSRTEQLRNPHDRLVTGGQAGLRPEWLSARPSKMGQDPFKNAALAGLAPATLHEDGSHQMLMLRRCDRR
jgi:hypothetical protein